MGRLRPGTVLAVLLLVPLAGWVILAGLDSEPHFADESAMIAQSYYYRLLKGGRWNHPDWLHYAALDHPPLPKYLFGLSLDLAGLPVPASLDWWMRWQGFERGESGWERRPGGGDFRPPEDRRVLFWARVPAALFGIGGVVGLFYLGLLLGRRTAGLVGALLLLADPLYLTHSRRAMSDAFAECTVIAAVALGIWGWRLLWWPRFRPGAWLAFAVGESLCCGLAALAKLNGGVATVIVLATFVVVWPLAAWQWLLVRRHGEERASGWNLLAGPFCAAAIAAGSFGLFLALNPTLTARPPLGPGTPSEVRRLAALGPVQRAFYLVQFRRDWSRQALANRQFRLDWLKTRPDRIRMTVWEGFGRYSPLGPRDIRTREPRPPRESFRDYGRLGCLIWLPLCLWGLWWSLCDGWSQFRAGKPVLAWALAVYALVVVAVVVELIPLNWDRYYLPLQAPAALLVPYGIASTFRWLRDRLVLSPPDRDGVQRG